MKADIKIKRTEIRGTDNGNGLAVVFSAWEPYDRHSTMTTIDGKLYGRIGTRPLTARLDALPASTNARIFAVEQFHAEQQDEAYAAICEEYPGTDLNSNKCMGEITKIVKD